MSEKANEMSDERLIGEPLIEVRDLSVTYEARRGAFIKRTEFIRAVKRVSFMVRRGTTMGLVGESGSGKSKIFEFILEFLTERLPTPKIHEPQEKNNLEKNEDQSPSDFKVTDQMSKALKDKNFKNCKKSL